MGIGEWIAFCSLILVIIGVLLKANYDKATLETRIDVIDKWKAKMEALDLLTNTQHEKDKTDCRTEIYKDISRMERKMDDFYRMVEDQNKRISCIDNNTIKIITILEQINKGEHK